MQVNWNGVLTIKNKERKEIRKNHMLWYEICKPRSSAEIFGNDEAKSIIRHWFASKQLGDKTSNCLFVYGPSGIGKSSFVELCSREHGFDAVITHADRQRTPQKLEAIFREAEIRGGMLIMDDFESFIRESSSIKNLVRMSKDCSRNLMMVIVCNCLDRSFQILKDCSKYVEFEPLGKDDMYRVLSRLSNRVNDFCYIPPMVCYFIAHGSTGNATQTLSQMQLMYTGTKEPKKRKRKKTKQLQSIDVVSKRDTHSKMAMTTYRNASIDNFMNDETLLQTLANMNKDFLEDLGNNLHGEYVKYFHNGSADTLLAMSNCIDCMSFSDLMKPESHEDSLYDTENTSLWSEDSKNCVIGLCRGVKILAGRVISNDVRRKRKKMVFEY